MARVGMLPDLEAERLGLCDLLETLDEAEWDTPSLCPGWMVRDVLAHLTLSNRGSLGGMIIRIIKARGDFDGVEADMARERAAEFTPQELIDQLRETAGADRRFPLSGKLDPLVDILVHGQDIVRPLGRDRAMPSQRVVPALDHVWGSLFYGSRKRFAGLRFVASDARWSRGEGPEVRGPAGDLLMLATGRAAGLTSMTGPGTEEAANRLKP